MRHATKTLFAAALLLASTAAASADAPAPYPTYAPPPAEVPIALMIDLSSGQTLYAREPDRRFMPASITKVMTAFTAFELIDAGKIKPEQLVLVDAQVRTPSTGRITLRRTADLAGVHPVELDVRQC